MTLSLSFHENFNFEPNVEGFEIYSANTEVNSSLSGGEIPLCADKLRLPELENYLPRPRLNDLLDKSLREIGATLITGRAGTGKTALAADFSKNYERAAWFSVEAADTDWNMFARYLTACFNESGLSEIDCGTKPAPFIENLFGRITDLKDEKPCLLVIDDIHHLFDADWFAEFFNALLYSLSPCTHLILLSRSNPAIPLWRLRSKRVLSVIDEKLLVFNDQETKEFFKQNGSRIENLRQAQKQSFGRISKLIELVNENRIH